MFRQLLDALTRENLISVNQDNPTQRIEGLRQASIFNGVNSPAATAYQRAITTNPTVRNFQRRYDSLTSARLPQRQLVQGQLAQQLATLTATSLAALPAAAAGRGERGMLDSINLLTTPATIGTTLTPADFYEANHPVGGGTTEQRITFSPRTGNLNPAQAFTHEGIHAIHDLYKTPHQQEMINFLAQEEARNRSSHGRRSRSGTVLATNRNRWLQPLLEGAQALINEPSFIGNYDYNGTLNPDITASFTNLQVPTAPGSVVTRPSNTFGDARTAIASDRASNSPSGDAFMGSLSEFPAFMSERLGAQFVVLRDRAGNPINDPARRFTKENLRTMYRDYNELSGNNLAAQYPLVHQAFFDRYNDLRNPNRVISPEPTRAAASLLKMGATPVPPGSPPGTAPVAKPPLLAYTPGVGGAPTPNPFPAPKYTTRAKGGHIKTKNHSNKQGISNFLKKLNNYKRTNFINAYQYH